MTTTAPTADLAGATEAPGRRRPLLPRLGGALLAAAPLLMIGGALTSPPQDSRASSDYVASLARDHAQTGLSAGLFHYGWICVAFGVIAALTLVPGRRGRGLTSIAAVATAFGAMQFSGLLLADFFNGYGGSSVPVTDATRIFDAVSTDPWVATWLISAQALGLLGLPLLTAGLARAGVVGWWTVVPMALAFMAPVILGGIVGGGVAGTALTVGSGLILWAPIFLVAARLVRRPALPVA